MKSEVPSPRILWLTPGYTHTKDCRNDQMFVEQIRRAVQCQLALADRENFDKVSITKIKMVLSAKIKPLFSFLRIGQTRYVNGRIV